MSRTARLVLPGASHYVLCRAAGRHMLFRTTGAYDCYSVLLGECAASAGVDIRAWVLLPTEVHLVVVPDRAGSIARAIRATHIGYDLVFPNGAHGRRRWRDRPAICALHADHTDWAIRRVEHTPVRLGLARSPEQYQWSSAWGKPQAIAEGPSLPVPDDSASLAGLTSHDVGLEVKLQRCLHTGRPMGEPDFRRLVFAYTNRNRHCRTASLSRL